VVALCSGTPFALSFDLLIAMVDDFGRIGTSSLTICSGLVSLTFDRGTSTVSVIQSRTHMPGDRPVPYSPNDNSGSQSLAVDRGLTSQDSANFSLALATRQMP